MNSPSFKNSIIGGYRTHLKRNESLAGDRQGVQGGKAWGHAAVGLYAPKGHAGNENKIAWWKRDAFAHSWMIICRECILRYPTSLLSAWITT